MTENQALVIKKARSRTDFVKIEKLITKTFDHEDIGFIQRYYKKFYKDDEAVYEDEVFVAKIGNEVIGVIGYCRDYFQTEYSYWLGWFCVDKGSQRTGVGSSLLHKVEDELRGYNIKRLFTSTDQSNEKAIGFYKRHDFIEAGELKDYYGPKYSQLILGKYL